MLERIVAWKLVDITLRSWLISLFNFGAILSQSAIDKDNSLIYNFIKKWKNYKVVTALEIDIQDKFNRITKAKLINQL